MGFDVAAGRPGWSTLPRGRAVVFEFELWFRVWAGLRDGGNVLAGGIHGGFIVGPAEVALVVWPGFGGQFLGRIEIFEIPLGLVLDFWFGGLLSTLSGLFVGAVSEFEVVVFRWVRLHSFLARRGGSLSRFAADIVEKADGW